MRSLGSRFWPAGPKTVDWTLDLHSRTFGPLRLGSSIDDVRHILGRPSKGTWFSKPTGLWYAALNLFIWFDDEKGIENVEVTWYDPGSESGFDPPVRVGGTTVASRKVTEAMINSAFGEPTMVDRKDALTIEWLRDDGCVYIDLTKSGKAIEGIGFMAEWLASQDRFH